MFVNLSSFYILSCHFLYFLLVEGKKKQKKGGRINKRSGGVEDLSYGLAICVFFAALCFVPALAYFAYNVARDPLTPSLVSNASKLLADKTTGYLSSRKKETKNA